jgi:PLP dependent protein
MISKKVSTVAERLRGIEERIARACERSGRRRGEVTLVAVSKTFPAEAVRAAHAAGVRAFGENRVEEALPKMAALRGLDIAWHMVGQVQSRKAKDAAPAFALIHSLDREKLARALDMHAPEGRAVSVLAQVDFSGDEKRGGVAPENLLPFLESLAPFGNLRVEGLMTLPPHDEGGPEAARPFFARLRELAARAAALNLPNVRMTHLSMGMSEDFEAAVEEGATLIRVGRAIFGERE